MLIAFNLVPGYLTEDVLVSVRKNNGEPYRELSREQVVDLCNKGLVVGMGSPSKLRKVMLVCESEEVDKLLEATKARAFGSINSAASRTVANETIYGKQITFKSYRHTANAFNPRNRRELAVYANV